MSTRWQSVRLAGPLTEFAAGFAADLERQAYRPAVVCLLVRLLARLSRWMHEHSVSASELDATALAAFVASGSGVGWSRGLATMLAYLRGLGVVPVPPPSRQRPGEPVLADFAAYLSVERALSPRTIVYYLNLTRPFVQAFWSNDDGALVRLNARDVSRYVAARLPIMENGRAKLTVTALRAFLRYAHVKGLIPQRLDSLVPAVAGWRKVGLPRQYAKSQVRTMLDSCDRSRPIGCRNYAMLLVLSRLGLRVSEVAGLTLDDLDWQHGTITVHGKGRQDDVLPVPVDVGSAIVEYLRHGRPAAAPGCRAVFLRCRAPYRGLTREAVGMVAITANRRAGITDRGGAHRLRHTLASDALNAGASLEEVGQVLRHRSASSTAIYANPRSAAAAPVGAAVADPGWCEMSTELRDLVRDYLRLRRSLGYQLANNEWILGGFLAYLDQQYPPGRAGFTVDDALTFAALPGASPSWHGRRLSIIRVFAAWAHPLDPRIPLIPAGLMPYRVTRLVPYLYTDGQIADLMGQAGKLRPRLYAATYQTLLGLLVVTGMRVGEVIALDTADLTADAAVLTIRNSKFGKSRTIPLHQSTVDAVTAYLDLRRQLQPSPSTPAMLVSRRGTRLLYSNVQFVVARLTRQAGITPRSARCRPRIHDIRHTFTVNSMFDAYRHGADPAARLIQLATYLGHSSPTGTYWYLTGSPELMAAAGTLADTPVGNRP